MRNRVEFENAVYGKVKSHEIRRRRNLTAISSTCAALVICVSLTAVLSRQDFDKAEMIETAYSETQSMMFGNYEYGWISGLGSASDDKNAVSHEPPASPVEGESEEAYDAASETVAEELSEMCPEYDDVFKILIEGDISIFGSDKLSDVMSILTEDAPASDGVAVTLYKSTGAEHYTVSSDNIAKLLKIIRE